MTQFQNLESALTQLPTHSHRPGGAAAIIQNGQLLAQHSWGFANMERCIQFTPSTLFRMCSITKQFTCGTLLNTIQNPQDLNTPLKQLLPNLQTPHPTALHLCHNQSGLRDYWATAMLHGAPIESPFGDHESQQLISQTRTLQFPPGTSYSYVNQNFRLLSDLLQNHTGKPFAHLLREKMFQPANMQTAFLAADTRAMPDATEGYEGTQQTGFRPAPNNIIWTGDAGLGASLTDIIAYEKYIDATRDNPESTYQRLAAPVTFSNGAPASYGFGLSHHKILGRTATSHGGALRGWRSHRLHLPAERLSVIIMFNHMNDAAAAAKYLLRALFNEPTPETTPHPAPPWLGTYTDPTTNLAARITQNPDSTINLSYTHPSATLTLSKDQSATDTNTTLSPTPSGLIMHRPDENLSTLLTPVSGSPSKDIEGHYHCAELKTGLTIANAGGTIHAAFSGFLGQGRMEILNPIATDLWTIPCPRALDHTPPGDWTLKITRNAANHPTTLTLGCWLARNLTYTTQPTHAVIASPGEATQVR